MNALLQHPSCESKLYHRLLITHLGRNRLDTVLILIAEIKSKIIPCSGDENSIKSMEQPEGDFSCLLFKGLFYFVGKSSTDVFGLVSICLKVR